MKQWFFKNIYLIIIITAAFVLRIYNLSSVPISLHGDEVGVGYNAFSLLTEGIDEYGQQWPLVLRADVAPIVFYATIPSIAFFGLTEIAVRFPSVIVGTISIFAIYFFVRELFLVDKKTEKISQTIALIAAGILAISPWHIQISRIAHDAPYGLLFQIVGTFFFLKGIRCKKNSFLILSPFLYGLSFYAYHSPRLTTPLLILGLVLLLRKRLWQFRRILLFLIIIFAVTIAPIALDFISKPLAQTRFGGINIFIRENTEQQFDLSYVSAVTVVFLKNYLNQFNLKFLFFDTSAIRYFNVSSSGLLYIWESVFLLLGAYYLATSKGTVKKIVLLWLLIAPLPGSLTIGNPNGGRIFMLLPVLSILVSLGVFFLFSLLKIKKIQRIVAILLGIIVFFSMEHFFHQYFLDAPGKFLKQWQYGAKEAAQYTLQREDQFDSIVITNQLRQEYIYILFYGKKNPRWLASLPNKERHTFIGFSSFGKYEFRKILWESDKQIPNALIVGLPSEIPKSETTDVITDAQGKAIIAFSDRSLR